MKSIARILAALLVLGVVPVAAGQAPHVSGTVTYRERVALSSSAIVEIRLEDVTRAGVLPLVVAMTQIDKPGQVPMKFDLPYDPRAIDAAGRYAVRAVISDGGVALFTSLDSVLVLTQGHGQRADLVLTRISGAKPPASPAQAAGVPPLPPQPLVNLPATFVGTLPCADCQGIHYQLNLFPDDSFFLRMTYAGKPGDPVDDVGSWAVSSDRRLLVLKGRRDAVEIFAIPAPGTLKKLDADGRPMPGKQPSELTRASAFRPVAVRLPMRGAYSSTADAATFIECSTGQRWPVNAEGAARDLENAYVKVRVAPGAPVLAEIEGAATPRPKIDGGGSETVLVVDKVVRLLTRESCEPRFSTAPLADTYWRLRRLGDRTIPLAKDQRREPSLSFQGMDGSTTGAFSGSSGCNRVVGTYVVANATMALTSGGTLMACKEEAATEAAFVAALKATRTYRIAGRILELMDATGATLARFEARPPSGVTVR